jgi:predicted KAP-like P-loop ATPase
VVGAEEISGRIEIQADAYISQIVRELLRRMEPSERFDALTDSVRNGAAIATIVDVVSDLGLEHGRLNRRAIEPESRRILRFGQLEQIEKLSVERIRQAANEGILTEVPRLESVLYRWRDWAGEAEPRCWIEEYIRSDDGLLRILEAFQGYATDGETVNFYLDPRRLESFVDPDLVIQRARVLQGRSDLTETQARAARTFVEGYDIWKQGGDPLRVVDS